MALPYVGRFAPSPTGPLHFGSLVAALASYLDARRHGGLWRLRMDDLDTPRNVPGAAEDILRTLQALGFRWAGPVVYQSERGATYAAALARLAASHHTFRCRCTRKEIADSSVIGIDGPVYPGTCRNASVPEDEAAAERMRAPEETVAFTDRIQGLIQQHLAQDIGDFVLKRRDGLFAYQLATVVDDAEAGVTHIVRGADLLDSTPRQLCLIHVLGLPEPAYAHIPVAINSEGQKLSKQTLAPAIDSRDAVAELNRALQFLGQATIDHAQTPEALLERAVAAWAVERVPKSRTAVCHLG